MFSRIIHLNNERGVKESNTLSIDKNIFYFYHILLYRVHPVCVGFELTTLVVIGTDCIGSCKPNYHTITTTTVTYFC